MDSRSAAGLAMVVLVVLAGCGGPALLETPSPTVEATGTTADRPPGPATTTAGTGTTPTPGTVAPWSKVALEGGNVSFDAAEVYRRVADLHGMALGTLPDVTVHVRDRTTVSLSRIYDPSRFERTLGIVPTAENTAIAGLASGSDVYLFAEVVTDPTEREAVLAHEFAHVVQHYLAARKELAANVDGLGTQRRRVVTALVEGTASYVEHRYRLRYLGGSDDLPSWREARSGRSAFGAFLVAPYVFGQRYVDRRVTDVTELWSVYVDPPTTTEQLIHDRDPNAEPARTLAVAAPVAGTGWSVADRRTKGELFVRLLLERQLPLDRAKRAAAGWGNDRLLAFGGDDAAGYAWLLRWDEPADADEFASAIREYLDARGVREDGGWTVDGTRYRVVEPANETVALLVGDEAFVAGATVSGDGGQFTVDPDG